MISSATFFGGAKSVTSGSGFSLTPLETRLYCLNASAPSLAATLPSARSAYLRLGGPTLMIWNRSGANSILLKDFAGTTLATLAVNDIATIGLIDNTTNAGKWYVSVKAKL